MSGDRRPTASDPEAEAAASRWYDLDEAIEEVRASVPAAVERALQFLAEDPNFHGSGYLKEAIWRRFMHVDAAPRQLRRLEDVALSYLERRMTREFWYMARTMAERASPAFWDDVRKASQVTDRAKKRRPVALLAYERGTAAGEAMREEVWYQASKERAARRRSRK
jgi:hypothetical protein